MPSMDWHADASVRDVALCLTGHDMAAPGLPTYAREPLLSRSRAALLPQSRHTARVAFCFPRACVSGVWRQPYAVALWPQAVRR